MGDFFGVAVVVKGEEAIKHFAAGGFADGEAEALFGVVEVVVEGEVVPAVGGGDGSVHLDVEVAEGLDIGVGAGGVVEVVVGFGEPFLAGLHNGLAMGVVGFAELF